MHSQPTKHDHTIMSTIASGSDDGCRDALIGLLLLREQGAPLRAGTEYIRELWWRTAVFCPRADRLAQVQSDYEEYLGPATVGRILQALPIDACEERKATQAVNHFWRSDDKAIRSTLRSYGLLRG